MLCSAAVYVPWLQSIMLEAKFKLNNRDLSRLVIGDRSFPAFSGHRHHTNRAASQCRKDQGPIPKGNYYIVDRATGLLQQLGALLSAKRDWFALFAVDENVDDFVRCQNVFRGQFRLHPLGEEGTSLGCVTVVSHSDFEVIRILIKSQAPKLIGNDIKAYGILRVY